MTPLMQIALLPFAPRIVPALDGAIARSMLAGYRLASANGRTPSEPDLVALLVTQGVTGFAGVLHPYLHAQGVQLRMTGVFCHGRPEVEHGSNYCELGDVLFVHFHTDSTGHEYQRSMLLQAKMSASPTLTVASKERHQLALYTEWGTFRYRRTARWLNGQTRQVIPAAAHAGAQYLLIDDRSPIDPRSGLSGVPGTFPMGTAPAQLHLALRQSLGATLLQMLIGNDGRPFRDRASARSDWDQVVWDLLQYGTQANFNQRRVGIRGQPRAVSAIVQAALANALVQVGDRLPRGGVVDVLGLRFDEEPPSSEPPPPADADGGGVSLVIIETRESRESGRG
jgi:hypothetical protein